MSVIENYPALRPTLLLDFANSRRVHPLLQFARASTATCYGPDGKLRTVESNVPRIDYDPATGKCLGLLVEEARTNLYTYSANVTNAVWGKTNLSADGSKVLVGGADFYKVSEVVTAQPAGKNVRRMFPSAYPAGTALSIKWCFIEGTRRFCNVVMLSGGATASIALDTKTGDFGIRQTGLPGWTWTVVKHLTGVIEVVAKNPSIHAEYPTGSYIDVRPTTVASLAEAGSIGDTYSGDTSQYVYIGPIQLELGASPTSYIPTDAAAVTRAADLVNIDFTLPTVGAVVASVAGVSSANSANAYLWSAINPSDNNADHAYSLHGQVSGASTSWWVNKGGVGQSGGNVTGRRLSAGFSFDASAKTAAIASGALLTLDESTRPRDFPANLSQLLLGRSRLNNGFLNGCISRLAVYSGRITNAQLQRLTA